jgi:hypothetical protein
MEETGRGDAYLTLPSILLTLTPPFMADMIPQRVNVTTPEPGRLTDGAG